MPPESPPIIRYKHIPSPSNGTTGLSGARNGRRAPGSEYRKTRTPAQTIANAESVPMFTSESKRSSGTIPARIATMKPVVSVVTSGVRVRGSILETIGGNILSRAMQ